VVLVTQLALAAGIAGMAFLSPRTDLAAIAWLALFVAFASASQDIVVDAYRTDVASREERGLAGALGVVGYRLAMLASGALALVLVAGSGWIPALGWRDTYFLMAALMAVGMVAVFWGEEPSTAPAAPKTLRDAVIEPLREFFSRPKAGWILVLLVLYKLGDAFAGSLTTAFLLRGAGFSLEDVGYVNKAVGLASTIVGVLFGGALMVRLGLYRALLGFGVLQAVSILAFMWLALAGKSYPIMVFAVGFENIAWGMGTAAFVALLMALCDHRFHRHAIRVALGARLLRASLRRPGRRLRDRPQVPGAVVGDVFSFGFHRRAPRAGVRVAAAQGDRARGSRGDLLSGFLIELYPELADNASLSFGLGS